jgi:hypothetical protein
MDFIGHFMRVLALLAVAVFWAGGTGASSIIAVSPPKGGATPSIIMLGAPAPSTAAAATAQPDPDVVAGDLDRPDGEPPALIGDGVELSPSVVALGEPGVEPGKVAAIDEKADAGRASHLLVIRGGVVGDAFSPRSTGQPVTIQPQTGDSGTGEPAAGDQQASDAAGNVRTPVQPKPGEAPPATSYPAAQPSAPTIPQTR